MTDWDEMEKVLTEERALLLEGRIGDLPGVAERKVAVLAEIERAGRPAEAPERLHQLALENAGLLEAAGRGIRSAIQRIEDARGARETRTYDARGRVSRLTETSGRHGTRV